MGESVSAFYLTRPRGRCQVKEYKMISEQSLAGWLTDYMECQPHLYLSEHGVDLGLELFSDTFSQVTWLTIGANDTYFRKISHQFSHKRA